MDVRNPYYDEAARVGFQWSKFGYDPLKGAHGYVIYRDPLVKKYAWAIPGARAVERLVELSPLIEIGAGNGYWAKMIAQAGGLIEAYDHEPGRHARDADGDVWYPVREGGVERITERHRRHTLFLCWPPYDDPMAADALCQFMDVGGGTVAYVGEGWGGCTGDDLFHGLLSEFFEEDYDMGCSVPQWSGIHDSLEVWRRK